MSFSSKVSVRSTTNCSGHGFTLIELLVVISIVALLVALLLPSLGKAKQVARIAVCAGNMRQIGVLTSVYTNDCRGYIPQPGTMHLINAGQAMSTSLAVGVHCEPGSNPWDCPEPRGTYPSVFGWFYRLKYLHPSSDITALYCPGSTGPEEFARRYGIAMWGETDTSMITRALANGSYTNPYGSGSHCVPDGGTSYFHRGWQQRFFSESSYPGSQFPKADDWRPDHAVAVDHERPRWDDLFYWDAHGDGLNILFHGGHVKFGGKDINAMKPHVYYTDLYFGMGPNWNGGLGGSSGWAWHHGWPGNSPSNAMWRYYETGLP